MEERREMNGQRMMTREELEMRLPALNHIAEQRDAKFRLRYAEKTVNNGIERGYTLDAGTRVSVNVYQNESWAQMPDEELFDTLNDLDGRFQIEIPGERHLIQAQQLIRFDSASIHHRTSPERQEVPFTLFAWLKLSPITVKSPISLFFFVRFYHLSSKKGHP